MEKALEVLLTASNEERKLRVKLRTAATLTEALDASIEFRNLAGDDGEDLNFDKFEVDELFDWAEVGDDPTALARATKAGEDIDPSTTDMTTS